MSTLALTLTGNSETAEPDRDGQTGDRRDCIRCVADTEQEDCFETKTLQQTTIRHH